MDSHSINIHTHIIKALIFNFMDPIFHSKIQHKSSFKYSPYINQKKIKIKTNRLPLKSSLQIRKDQDN